MAKAVLLPKDVSIANAHYVCNAKSCMMPIMRNISTLYMNHVISAYHRFFIRNSSVVLADRNSLTEIHLRGSGWGVAGWGVWNSLISKNLAHYCLSLKYLLIL